MNTSTPALRAPKPTRHSQKEVAARTAKAAPRAAQYDVDVTVMVPLYNYGRFVRAAADSVLAQKGVDLELIIVDDVSTDDSLAVARSVAREDPRVTVLANEVNGGPVACVHAALAVARGEFLWYLDADDLITPGALARAVAVARAFPSVDLVYGHPLHFADGDPLPAARTTGEGCLVWEGRDWLMDRCRTASNVISSCEALQRRSTVERIGSLTLLPHTFDLEMWLRLSAAGEVAYLRGVDQGLHRKHPVSMSMVLDPLGDLIERRLAFDTFFAGQGGELPNAALLREASQRALAATALDKACQLFDGGTFSNADSDRYRDFARESYPAAATLPEWGELARRLAIGGAHRNRPRFVAERVARRIRSDRSWRQWHTEGVFR